MAQQLEHGVVEAVAEEGAADELVQAAAAGATTLYLGDAVDFAEDGGTLTIGAEVLAYSSADLDTDVLVLADPTTVDYEVGETVQVYPPAPERVAVVRLDEDGEAVDARVPHALYDRIPEGIREDDLGERVSLTLDGAAWVVADVLGKEPSIDGTFVDLTDVALPGETDGLPPPQVTGVTTQGGIGTVFVKWDAVDNDDPVTYSVHAAAAAPVATDATTLVGEIAGTLLVARKMPDGSAIPTDTDTQFVVVASDADGPGPASPATPGRALLVTGPDVAAHTITGDQIAANSITADEIAADAITANELAAGAIDGTTITGATVRTSATGNRLELVNLDELRSYSGDALEVDPATLKASVHPTTHQPVFELVSGLHSGGPAGAEAASLYLRGPGDGGVAGPTDSTAVLEANYVTIEFGKGLSLYAGLGVTPMEFKALDGAGLPVKTIYLHQGWKFQPFAGGWTIDANSNGSVGTGTFRDSVDARVSAVAPAVTMTTGSVGTGTFRDSVRQAVPTGVVQMWAGGTTPPTGWALCDGAVLNTATSPALFAVIGYTYGGSGTSFNLPDLRGRFPYGATPGGVSGYREPGAYETQQTGGSAPGAPAADTRLDHRHTHSIATATNTTTGGGATRANTGTTDSAGLNNANTSNHGLLTIHFIIKT